jgi:hypothetical protein
MDAYEQAGTVDAGEPTPDDPLTGEEMAAISPDRLEELGLSLARRRDDWVAARRACGVEKRWIEDVDQYLGRDEATRQTSSMMDSVERGFPVTNQAAKPQRSTVFVNITRPKTNAAEARLANMLLPTDDRNWGIKPTPVPELVKAALQQADAQAAPSGAPAQGMPPGPAAAQPGADPMAALMGGAATPAAPGTAPLQPPAAGAAQPVTGAPQPAATPVATQPGYIAGMAPTAYQTPDAQAQLQVAAQRAKAMQDEIDDQLTECNYNGQARLMLHDCAVLGTGILKGPIVVNRVRKAWKPLTDAQRTVHMLEIVEETRPASERVDPWNVFPDPGCSEDVHAGRGIFEKKTYTSKQLRELVKQPGYLKAQISKVLEEGPQLATSPSQRDSQAQRELTGDSTAAEHYEMWEYWGEFSPEDLRAAGVDVPDGATEAISGCVIIVNETVIKGFLNPIETGDLPYDFMVWEKVDGSCWGYGVPYLCRPAQRVLNAAWRQLMDNSGLSVGPNIVLKPTILQPADGRWEITGRKIWYLTDDAVDARQAVATFDFPNHGQEIQQIIDLALKFADEESSVPMLAQGEKGNAPDTVGGMTILMNSSNVVLGRMVRQFDDCVTRPHIRRYYDWNMAYSDKDAIKGDFQVDARGSSALLVRDVQNQALIQLGQFQASGIVAPMVNWEAWFKEVLKAQHIDPTDIMKTEAEIAQLQHQPPQATPEQIRANTMLQVAQLNAQSRQQVAQAKAQGELAYAQTEASMAHDNHGARLQEMQMKRDLALLEYAQQHQLTLEQVKADLTKTAMQERTKRELAAAELQMRANESDKTRAHAFNREVLLPSGGSA